VRGRSQTGSHMGTARITSRPARQRRVPDARRRGRDPIAYALGFLNCRDISARCMLSIFQFFATKTDASVLRMLNGSPAERLLAPIADYITAKCAGLPVATLRYPGLRWPPWASLVARAK